VRLVKIQINLLNKNGVFSHWPCIAIKLSIHVTAMRTKDNIVRAFKLELFETEILVDSDKFSQILTYSDVAHQVGIKALNQCLVPPSGGKAKENCVILNEASIVE
jgi:hypothetical protein